VVEKEEVFGSASRKGILEQLLEIERSSTLETHPAYFELAFGPSVGRRRDRDPDLPFDQTVDLDGVRLRGKIDRVDIGPSFFSVIDYKTGKTVPKLDEVEEGTSLQLPLYLHAVEQILGSVNRVAERGVAGMYYKLRDPVRPEVGIASREYAGRAFTASSQNQQVVPDDEALRGIIRTATDHVRRYAGAIAGGVFIVEPKDPGKVCQYCAYETVCRIRTRASAGPAGTEGEG
jgi:ATP-dependent helicase/DNAse subunit B